MSDSDIRIGIIGGTGLGEKLGLEQGKAHDIDTPFGKPSAPLVRTRWEGTDIVLLQRHGVGHLHNPTQVPYRANIFAMKMLGVTHILASGATGSLREELRPGDLVLVDQVIDKTHKRPSTFFDKAAVHVEFADPFCPVMRDWLVNASRELDGVTVHLKGCYVCMEGPQFSTRAESHMHRAWGGDLIGMTVMPEAKLAREAEIAYAMIAMPTDYDCWRPHDGPLNPHALLEEIIGNLNKATANNIQLMKAALRDLSFLKQHKSPAHAALAMGIWSNKPSIDKAEVERLAPLWGKYFD